MVSEALVTSRWLAPEIINPPPNGNTPPLMESKASDIFAFGMFAVEVFTGKVPFEEQRNDEVVLHIWRGGRPEKPDTAHAVGLTDEMWEFIKNCWQQDPNRRPTVVEVVRRWQEFVANDDVTECVRITLGIQTSVLMFNPVNRNPRRGSHLEQAGLARGLRPFNPEQSLSPLDPGRLLEPSNKERCPGSSARERRQRLTNKIQSPRLSSDNHSIQVPRRVSLAVSRKPPNHP